MANIREMIEEVGGSIHKLIEPHPIVLERGDVRWNRHALGAFAAVRPPGSAVRPQRSISHDRVHQRGRLNDFASLHGIDQPGGGHPMLTADGVEPLFKLRERDRESLAVMRAVSARMSEG